MAETILVLGAGGRTGRLLRPYLDDALSQSRNARRASAGGCLDPLSNAAGLLRLAGRGARMLVLAGVTYGTRGDLRQNRTLALAALWAARMAGVGRVLIASSAAVCGRGGRFAESDRCAPARACSAAGLAVERAAGRRIREASSAAPPTGFLGIGNVAGADCLLGGSGGKVPLERCARGRRPLRSCIGPRTLARALSGLAGLADPTRIINVAAPPAPAMGDPPCGEPPAGRAGGRAGGRGLRRCRKGLISTASVSGPHSGRTRPPRAQGRS
jgi:hypothetical protein